MLSGYGGVLRKRTIKIRIRRAAKAGKVALPDPDEFLELMDRVRKKRR
jgi:hypothetical protein